MEHRPPPLKRPLSRLYKQTRSNTLASELAFPLASSHFRTGSFTARTQSGEMHHWRRIPADIIALRTDV